MSNSSQRTIASFFGNAAKKAQPTIEKEKKPVENVEETPKPTKVIEESSNNDMDVDKEQPEKRITKKKGKSEPPASPRRRLKRKVVEEELDDLIDNIADPATKEIEVLVEAEDKPFAKRTRVPEPSPQKQNDPPKLTTVTPTESKKKEEPKKEEKKKSEPTVVEKKVEAVKPKKEGKIEWNLSSKTSESTSSSNSNSSSVGTNKHLTLKYDPVSSASWKKGEPVPYMALAQTFDEIEGTSARLRIIELMTNLFRSIIALTPNDLLPAIYLSVNRLAPEFVGLELGIGESILMKAIAEATGRTMASLKASYDEMGDLGKVAQASRSNQRTMMQPAKLTLQGVYKKLKEIASLTGNSSQNRKKDLIRSLLVACRECEATFIIKSLQGKLRIGLAEKSVIAALAHAIILTPPNGESAGPSSQLESKMAKANETLRSVYSELPDYDKIIPTLLRVGIDRLSEECHLTPGVPVHPMLAQPTKGITEVLDRFSNSKFACEYKYDGERAQIHFLEDGTTKVYSRNLENNTEKFPDVIQYLPRAMKPGVTSYILDCEAVAFDRTTNKILPFQVLSTRARKGVQIADIKVQVCLYAFDLLFLNGKPLIREPFIKRRELLHESFTPVLGEFAFAQYKDTSDVEEIQTFLTEAVEGNCEGLMIKTLEKDATYEPSRRSYNWLKVKKDYIEGMGDSVDLVVIGAYVGRGKRTGVYGGYLLACYDDESESYQSVCKLGTGFSDEDLQKLAKFFQDNNHIIPEPKKYYYYGDNVAADVWFEPVQVWEVKAADLSVSPVHQAAVGLIDPSKGVALRFPRFIRVREDKKPEQATTGTQIAELYRNQKINHSNTTAEDDDDF